MQQLQERLVAPRLVLDNKCNNYNSNLSLCDSTLRDLSLRDTSLRDLSQFVWFWTVGLDKNRTNFGE